MGGSTDWTLALLLIIGNRCDGMETFTAAWCCSRASERDGEKAQQTAAADETRAAVTDDDSPGSSESACAAGRAGDAARCKRGARDRLLTIITARCGSPITHESPRGASTSRAGIDERRLAELNEEWIGLRLCGRSDENGWRGVGRVDEAAAAAAIASASHPPLCRTERPFD